MCPEQWWYLSELARHLETSASSLQRELASLSASEILLRKRDGNRIYYRANPECPLFPELRGLIAKTTGLVGVLHDALEPLMKRMRVAFVYGSVARHEEGATSDVDLFIVGDVGLKDLAPAIRIAANRLGRPVNPTVYPAREFADKLAAGNLFLRTVLDDDKLFVMGTADDLGAAAATEAPPAGGE